MKRLAVIISYYTTPNQLEDSLLSLLENRPDSCDIFVMQCKPYENPYDLDNEEVHFLVAPEVMNEENPCLWESLRKALAACNAEYVCLLPAGVHFQSCWVAALDILDRHDDLGGFFLDENLDNGGFFRKTTLEQYVQTAAKPSENGENMPGNTDADCLYSLVSLIQEDGWTCGLAEFEEKENQEIITEKVTERITEKKSENVGNIPVTVTGCIAGSIAGYATGTVIGNATGVTTENITNAIIGSVTENFTDAVTESVTENITDAVTGSVTENFTDAVTESVTENFTDAVTESVTENFTDAVTGSVTESMNDYKESIMGNMDENIFNGNIQELTENMLSNVTENIGGYTGNVTEGATESIQEYAGSLSENVLGMAESLNLGNIHENIGNVIEDFTEKMPDISLPEGLNIPEEIGNGILGQIFTFCRKILTRS